MLVLLLALRRYHLLSQFLCNEIYISVVASSLRYSERSTIRKVKISFLLRVVYSTTKRRDEETFQFRKAAHCKRRSSQFPEVRGHLPYPRLLRRNKTKMELLGTSAAPLVRKPATRAKS